MPQEKNSYENSLTGLARNYGNYFEDKGMQFGAEAWSQMIDPDTLEMLSVSARNDVSVPEDFGDWRGKKCYEYLEHRDSPCEECPIKKARRDDFYVCTKKNGLTGRELLVEAIMIEHCGKPAVLEKAIDISDPVYKERVVNQYMVTRNLSNTVLGMLMDSAHITENFEGVCKEICDFFDADRALISEYCSGKLGVIWSKLPQPFTQVCTELSDEAVRNITEATASLNYIWVPDVPNADKLDTALREYWASRGIESILLIPMSYDGIFIGTVSLHNIRKNFNAIDVLRLIGLAVAKCIHARVMETKAEKQLYSDPLTGALNLSGLIRRSRELFREHPENRYYFCSMDIRYFGGINRRYGFELGDRILVKISEMLGKYMDIDEAFCRISADVFCFLAKFPGEEEVERRFRLFAEGMQSFEDISAADLSVEFRCGAYIIDGDRDIAQAIDKANLARLSLNDETGSSIAFFSMDLLEKSKYETELLQDFRPALSRRELTVYFQPQCSYSTQRIVGAEALVRWKSSRHGNVPPMEFIPLLERHGLIYELDKYVWEEVCRYQKRWIEMGCECPVSVNLSRHDVLNNNICEELCSLLDKYSIPKRLIPLEITETAYIKDSEELIGAVDKLKEAGFIVEMDDFGSGYSSLNALKDISVDLLKLDMKFLDMSERTTGKGSSILNCIVRMTRWLDLAVLAEGVETREQAEYLKNIGCDLMQGFYFAKPMPAEEFEELLLRDGIASGGESAEEKDGSLAPDKFMESLIANPQLFNNMGAAAIAEHKDGVTEALMVNDSFLKMLETTREDYQPYMKDMRDYAVRIAEDPEQLNFYADTVMGTRLIEFSMKSIDGTSRKLRMTCRRLLKNSDGSSIILICLDDITKLSKHYHFTN